MQFFERATENRGIPRPKPLSAHNIFPTVNQLSRRPETSTTDNNPSSLEAFSHAMTTSTPQPIQTPSKSSNHGFWHNFTKKSGGKKPPSLPRHYSSDSLHPQQTPRHEKTQNLRVYHPATTVDRKREMEKVFHDLDTFIEKELNEIQVRKRIGKMEKPEKIKEIVKESDDKFLASIQELKNEVREIKENQKLFEDKIKRHEQMQSNLLSQSRRKLEYETSSISSTPTGSKKKERILKKPMPTPSKVQYTTVEVHAPPPPPPLYEKIKNNELAAKIPEIPLGHGTSTISLSVSEPTKEEKMARVESELFKAETLMMKINRVLETIGKVDEHNIDSIINIERHYLVASTRFQSALCELRKMNDNVEENHPAPFNRKGKLVMREIMLEVKSAYFQRKVATKNEFLLVMIKYDDKVMASNPIRIQDDVRIIKFPECFSIPEAYADFEMRLEVYGTTFWRKNTHTRETMLKKYGFVTFTLADTGIKHKRFHMIEVMQSENVPIRSKILMRITQKITAGVQFKGLLFVKIREVWHETSTHLNGHILEISFKTYSHNSLTQSRETLVLDLYNYDSDAVIPVDTRVSKRPFSFSLKFNHYVDVANF